MYLVPSLDSAVEKDYPTSETAQDTNRDVSSLSWSTCAFAGFAGDSSRRPGSRNS
jgi:hypothetical protein